MVFIILTTEMMSDAEMFSSNWETGRNLGNDGCCTIQTKSGGKPISLFVITETGMVVHYHDNDPYRLLIQEIHLNV